MAYGEFGVKPADLDPMGYDEPQKKSFISALIGNRPADAIAIAIVSVLGIGVVINAVALQQKPHPAPMFAPAKPETPKLADIGPSVTTLTPADTMTTASILQPTVPPTMQSLAAGKSEIPATEEGFAPALDKNLVKNIQTELMRRGFYAGKPDGEVGPQTESAVKSYQQMAKLAVNGEITDDLLIHMRKSSIRKPIMAVQPMPQKVSVVPAALPASRLANVQQPVARPKINEPSLSVQPSRNNGDITASIPKKHSIQTAKPLTTQLTPEQRHSAKPSIEPPPFAPKVQQPVVNKTMMSAERALSKSGYGPLKADGIYDVQTRNAIMRFEKDRGLPVTGQLSGAVIKALAETTGETFR